MTTQDWYVAMGEAVKERNRALSMVDNWQEKVRAAEARIDELADRGNFPTTEAQEQVPTEQVQE